MISIFFTLAAANLGTVAMTALAVYTVAHLALAASKTALTLRALR